MKNSILVALLFSSSTMLAQTTSPIFQASAGEQRAVASGPEFTWDLKEYNFGEIAKDKPVTAEYKFKNTGNKPIIISEVKKTCGCTVPKWPEQPIMPGEEAVIKATYNAKNPGAFNKTITVVSNAEENYIYLRLKGKVLAAETTIDQL
ncbi:MAG: DUF1573 domain-containing protein [Flavobacteriales bacterium]|nr:DUF1573 domain-containing protein [Flavobacteriales bacterium]